MDFLVNPLPLKKISDIYIYKEIWENESVKS